MTEAATLPRSLTARPFSRAQARTSALLGRPFSAVAGRLAFSEPAAALAAVDRGFLDLDSLRFCSWALDALTESSPGGAVASWSPDTTNVTPYIAPRTRIADSRGSAESRVIFTAVAFQHVHRCGTPGPPEGPNATRKTGTVPNKRFGKDCPSAGIALGADFLTETRPFERVLLTGPGRTAARYRSPARRARQSNADNDQHA
jgi:hypothetical protein